MKEFGVILKGKELNAWFSTSVNKIKGITSPLWMLSNDKEDYKPFLRKNGVDLPMNYKRVITSSKSESTEITEFINDKEVVTNNYGEDCFKTIHFIIEEI